MMILVKGTNMSSFTPQSAFSAIQPSTETVVKSTAMDVRGINLPSAPSQANSALAKFSNQDLERIRELKTKLVTLDRNAIATFPNSIQNEVAHLADEVLEHTKGKDYDVIGGRLTDIVILAKGIQPKQSTSLPIIGTFINNIRNSKERIMGKFNSASTQIDTIVHEVDQQSKIISSRLGMLDQLYQANIKQYHDLDLHIAATKLAIEEATRQTDAFAALLTPTSDPFDVQQVADARQQIVNMSKMLSNFERLSMAAVQAAPRIRSMQMTGTQLVDMFQTITSQVIPSWKRNFLDAIIIEEQARGAQLANVIADATNALERDNATRMREVTVAVAKQNQRGIVDLETLELVQSELITSIDEVNKINAEGQMARKQVSQRIDEMKQQLQLKLS